MHEIGIRHNFANNTEGEMMDMKCSKMITFGMSIILAAIGTSLLYKIGYLWYEPEMFVFYLLMTVMAFIHYLDGLNEGQVTFPDDCDSSAPTHVINTDDVDPYEGEKFYIPSAYYPNGGDAIFGDFVAPVFQSINELRKHYPVPMQFITMMHNSATPSPTVNGSEGDQVNINSDNATPI